MYTKTAATPGIPSLMLTVAACKKSEIVATNSKPAPIEKQAPTDASQKLAVDEVSTLARVASPVPGYVVGATGNVTGPHLHFLRTGPRERLWQ